MKRVDIIDTMPTNGRRLAARCILDTDDGEVRIETDDDHLRNQLSVITDRTSGSWAPLTPKDGIKYLRALKGVFRSADRMATDILEGPVPQDEPSSLTKAA